MNFTLDTLPPRKGVKLHLVIDKTGKDVSVNCGGIAVGADYAQVAWENIPQWVTTMIAVPILVVPLQQP